VTIPSDAYLLSSDQTFGKNFVHFVDGWTVQYFVANLARGKCKKLKKDVIVVAPVASRLLSIDNAFVVETATKRDKVMGSLQKTFNFYDDNNNNSHLNRWGRKPRESLLLSMPNDVVLSPQNR
jgi:hypothetical protein